MIEIFLIIALTRQIGTIVEEKGYPSLKYKALTVLLWFGGELVGLFLGVAFTNGESQCLAYFIALLGAAIGAKVAHTMAQNLQPINKTISNG